MKRILTCYNCKKTFASEESEIKRLSYGEHKGYCVKCWNEYLQFCKRIGETP